MQSGKAEAIWNLLCEDGRFKISQAMQTCTEGAACGYCKERIMKDWDQLDARCKAKISYYLETGEKYTY